MATKTYEDNEHSNNHTINKFNNNDDLEDNANDNNHNNKDDDNNISRLMTKYPSN